MASVPLEYDSSILEKNLLLPGILGGDEEESLSSLLLRKTSEGDPAWKPVTPTPGYVVKLKTREGDKVFVNVCHTDGIPAARDVTERELLEMLASPDMPSFRIPISIGELHVESDKSKNPCAVYDIAVNSDFFKKMQTSEVYNSYFLTVSLHALDEKYDLQLNLTESSDSYVILKNRKSIGKLLVHRIQQREVKKAPGELIQEIKGPEVKKKQLIEVIEDTKIEKNNKKVSFNEVKTERRETKVKKELVEGPVTDCRANMKRSVSEPERFPLKTECPVKEEPVKSPVERLSAKSSGDSLPEKSSAERLPVLPVSDTSQGAQLLTITQHPPDSPVPEYLQATIHLSVNSSKSFGLTLDSYRLVVTMAQSSRPWFDITIPYRIDVSKSFGYFVVDKQKLIVHLQVQK